MAANQSLYNKHVAEGVALFAQYVSTLESNLSSPIEQSTDRFSNIRNGEATEALQTLVPIEIRKEAGIFFTSTDLANKVAKEITPMLQHGITICDPASGAGNLLVACAQHLPFGSNLQETLSTWSALISGYDLFPEFIKATKLRLLILAMQHHNVFFEVKELNLDSTFENLRAEDVFLNRGMVAECIVMNPPFGYISVSNDCTWASGKVQTAAWFFEKILKSTPSGKHIVAILPDVLKSGSRYEHWRNIIAASASTLSIQQAGRFDPETDVDVFILHMVTGQGQLRWSHNLQTNSEFEVVSDYFQVRVGAVVPHRDPEEGNEYPYIHARTAPEGKIITEINERKKFNGTVFKPPFVLVHRTSSPSDKNRCVASIVNIDCMVAVENHLLVCLPKDGSLSSCVKLLKHLSSRQASIWMNKRIRCRHLTVNSLSKLPYSPERRGK